MWEPEAMPSPETMVMVESMACKLLSEDEVAAVMRHCNRVSMGLCIHPSSMSAKQENVRVGDVHGYRFVSKGFRILFTYSTSTTNKLCCGDISSFRLTHLSCLALLHFTLIVDKFETLNHLSLKPCSFKA